MAASAAQTHRLQAELNLLTQLPPNKRCADCDVELSAGGAWADVMHGVFICKTCSGAHRALGARYATVKSVRLDTWSAAHVAARHTPHFASAFTIPRARLSTRRQGRGPSPASRR